MKPHSPRGLVDQLGRLAGGAESPSIDDATARRMIDRAMRSASSPELAQVTPRIRRWPLAFATAAVAAAAVWWLAPRAVAPPSNVMHVTLPTGDRLVGVGGAQFDVERLAADDRRLRLRSGTVLFDVAHVAPDQRFQVATAHLVAIARGTVFSVETDAASSHVRVYEGIVEIEQDGDAHLVAAGAVWDSATRTASVGMPRPIAIAANIDDAVHERIAARAASVAAAIAMAPRPDPVTSDNDVVRTPEPVTTSPAPSSSEPVTATRAEPRESLAQLLATARAELEAGKLEAALATAQLAAGRGPWSGAWWQLVGDAARGLGRTADAADAFDHAARELTGAERCEAGYSAAYLRFHDLLDGESALTSLDASAADGDGSPLEERALGLRVQILAGLGRREAARESATRYLSRFPTADLRAYMATVK